ncbi:MAG TPA: hypothetical protein VF516_22455, partial [Kofleriaceae bacterium]
MDDRARALWRRHIKLDVIATAPLRGDAAAARAELIRRGEHASADVGRRAASRWPSSRRRVKRVALGAR